MQLPAQIPFTCITVEVVGKRKADECQQIKGGSSQTQHRSRIEKSHLILKTKSAPQNTFRQNIWRLSFMCKTFFCHVSSFNLMVILSGTIQKRKGCDFSEAAMWKEGNDGMVSYWERSIAGQWLVRGCRPFLFSLSMLQRHDLLQ